jgi:hypothetical protein
MPDFPIAARFGIELGKRRLPAMANISRHRYQPPAGDTVLIQGTGGVSLSEQ